MTMRRSVPRGRIRRPMSWVVGEAIPQGLAAGSQQEIDLLASRSDFQRTDVTVTRVRGAGFLRATSDGVADHEMVLGIIVITQQAFTVGGTSVPDPDQDNADWLWWNQVYSVPAFQEDSAGVSRIINLPTMFEIDSKAQRKMNEENQTLVLVIKNAGSVTIQFGMRLRSLLKR